MYGRQLLCLDRTAGAKAGIKVAVRRGGHTIDVEDAEEFLRKEQPHRMIMMKNTSKNAPENRIAASELLMLLSWMDGGMGAQAYALCRDGVRGSNFDMIFPVGAMFSFHYSLFFFDRPLHIFGALLNANYSYRCLLYHFACQHMLGLCRRTSKTANSRFSPQNSTTSACRNMNASTHLTVY